MRCCRSSSAIFSIVAAGPATFRFLARDRDRPRVLELGVGYSRSAARGAADGGDCDRMRALSGDGVAGEARVDASAEFAESARHDRHAPVKEGAEAPKNPGVRSRSASREDFVWREAARLSGGAPALCTCRTGRDHRCCPVRSGVWRRRAKRGQTARSLHQRSRARYSVRINHEDVRERSHTECRC